MWKSTKGKPLPGAGEVFLAPLGHGLYSFCWIAGHAEVRNGGDFITYAMASWVSKQPPTQAEIDGRTVLVLTEGGQAYPYVCKMSESPPRSWKRLGVIADPARGVPAPAGYNSCSSFAWVALREWQWLHDRGQRAKDDAAEAKAMAADEEAETGKTRALAAKRKQGSLASLARSPDLLFEWDGLVRKPDRLAVQKLIQAGARALAKLPATAKPAAKRAVLQATFEAINAWNDRRNVIDTPEREALIDALDDIAHAAGLRGKDLGKAWRDW